MTTVSTDRQTPPRANPAPWRSVKAPPHGERRRRRALLIIRHATLQAGIVGLLPAPLVDQVIVGCLLGKLLCDLFALYGIPVSDHKLKTLIAAVLGGAHTEWIAHYLLGYAERLPRVFGLARLGGRPMVAAATTYAVGLLFLHHLDRGAWPAPPVRRDEPVPLLPPRTPGR